MKQKTETINVSDQCLISPERAAKSSATDDSSKFGGQKEVARIYRLSEPMLERDRWDGKLGIPYYKIGRKILYKFSEIEEWIEKRRQMNTSDVRQIV